MRSVVGVAGPGAEVGGAAPGLDQALLRLALHPPGPAEHALPACAAQGPGQLQLAAGPLLRELLHGMSHLSPRCSRGARGGCPRSRRGTPKLPPGPAVRVDGSWISS